MTKNKQLSDQQIIEHIQLGKDDQALTQVYQDNYMTIERYILNNKGKSSDAKDVFQETVMVFYKNALDKSFVLTSSLKTYLYAIAKNLWLKQLQNTQKITHLNDGLVNILEDVLEEKIMTDEIQEKREKIAMQEIEIMGDPCKTILFKYYFYKKNMEEIAQEMNYTNANNAKNQKYKCMKRLQKLVLEKMKGY